MHLKIINFFRKIAPALVVPAFAAVVFFALPPAASAGILYLTGWAWAGDDNVGQGLGPMTTPGGMGWISFSCASGGYCTNTTRDHFMAVDTVTGKLFGYAWSSNYGWITFNEGDMGTHCPSPPCYAEIDLRDGSPTRGQVHGWATACAVFERNCSGARKLLEQTGSWDGLIHLGGAFSVGRSYGWAFVWDPVRGVYTSNGNTFAWGGQDTTQSPVGWVLLDASAELSPTPPPSNTPSLSLRPDGSTSVCSGNTATFNWFSLNVNRCEGEGPSGWAGPQPLIGSHSTGALTSDTTYTLKCTNSTLPGPIACLDPDVDVCQQITYMVTPPCPPTPPGNGVFCGAANGGSYRTPPPTAELCSSGATPSPIPPALSGTTWTWTCTNASPPVTDSCSAQKRSFNFNFMEF